MENKLLEDIQKWVNEMSDRIKESKEGGFIVLATDDNRILSAVGAKERQMKRMISCLLEDKNYSKIILEIIRENKQSKIVDHVCKKSAESN